MFRVTYSERLIDVFQVTHKIAVFEAIKSFQQLVVVAFCLVAQDIPQSVQLDDDLVQAPFGSGVVILQDLLEIFEVFGIERRSETVAF